MKKLILVFALGLFTISCATISTIPETSKVTGVETAKRPKKGKFIVTTDYYQFRTDKNFQIGDELQICK
jgi:hypothetical protein